jgi:adenylate kinase family enzyme
VRCFNRNRSDDNNSQIITKRIQLFDIYSTPVLDYFENINKLRIIDSSKSVNEVI